MDSPDQSLRRYLLVRLLTPLLVVLILGALGAFVLARGIGTEVHDNWLYDSAMSLSEQIEVREGKVVLDIPKPAIEMFEWDKYDLIFEEVTSRKQGKIFGNTRFPAPPNDLVAGTPRFYDGVIDGHPVRIVAVLVDTPPGDSDVVVVQVAETKRKRESLTTRIVWLIVPLELLRELLGNLVDNAIQYGRTGGQVTVSLTTSPVTLTVDDDGPGIPSDEWELVLEPFYRLRGSAGNGCGLGLAIAQDIAARHGSSLSIQDAPQGKGVRVRIVLPERRKPAAMGG